MGKNNDVCCDNRKQDQINKKQEQTREQVNNEKETPAAAAAGSEIECEVVELDMLHRQIDILEQEKEELMQRLLRSQADFDNFRKRTRAEKEEMVDYAAYELVCRLLPVIDNLERACASTETGSQGLAEGIAMITRQFKDLLEKEGVKAIECKGKTFDPACHEAVMREESGDQPPNTVVEELQKGYMMKDRVVRPSMVKVAVKEQ